MLYSARVSLTPLPLLSEIPVGTVSRCFAALKLCSPPYWVAETDDTIAVTETIPEAALLRVLQQRGLLDTPAGRSHPPAHDDEDTVAVTETLPNAALLSAMQQQGLFDVSSSRHSTQTGMFRPLFHTRFLLINSL